MAAPGTDAGRIVTRLYTDHSAALRGYVTKLLHDRQLAEDVVHETMLRAWRHADRLGPDRGNPLPWLKRVAHNIAVDRIRAQAARPTEAGDPADHCWVTYDHTDQVVTAQMLSVAVRRLHPKHRAVLYQLYVAGHSASSAADALGIPVGTVKSRLHKALRELRRALADRPYHQAA